MRAFILAVTGLIFAAIAACSSYGTSVVEVRGTKTPVASVSIKLPVSLAAGQSARATAIPKDANGVILTGRPVAWFTSSASIASVSDSGVVSAVAPGTALVSAVSEGVSGQATVAVTPPPPTPIATVIVTLSPSAVVAGQTAQASATLEDSSGNPISGRVVTWQSSNTTVATVDPVGAVKAIASGNAMIKASSEGKSNASALSVSAPAPIPVAVVSVTPSSASLQVGATVQLSATTRDSNNNVLTGRVIGWSSGNSAIATVSSSGLVTAKGAGSVSIAAASEGQTGSATITVSAPAPVPVATVSVSPATPSLQVGDTLRLSATTRDVSNNVLTGRVVSWTSSNPAVATVSTSGLATALAAGTVQINATSELKIGIATLTISAAPPPPPPGSGPTWRGNEPAGMTSINERGFNALNEDPAWENLSAPGASIATDATAPHSPSSVLRINYPAGFIGGGSPESTEILTGDFRVYYFCYWVKHSANWQGHVTGVSKHGYVWMGNNPLFVYEAEGVGSGPLHTRMALQGVVAEPNADGWYGQNLLPNATFTRGQWDYVEILLTGNTAGTKDGALDVYLNGAHVSHWTGIQYSTATTAWTLSRIYPVWGGIGDVVNADQYIEWDHIYMSGKR
jgi:uncharacterized protein YjdB